ncbi:MAG: family 1 glycosylhydrolase [Candidatus Dormibacteraeota bacterium]|nr:family 1 glycosylhydrolase [Candidatus Dormibacteraeota bacterium]
MPGAKTPTLEVNQGFAFATGIECSAPVIEGGVRMDELEKTGHYRHYEEDIRMVAELGIQFLRYGIPFHQVCARPGSFDWSFTDRAMEACQRHGVVPIADLMHFGVPDHLGNFQNPRVAEVFADYALAFAERFPWVRYYTLVNEPLVTARFSAQEGWWNERLASPAAFTRAMLNIGRCIVLAHQQVQARRPDAIYLQSESCEYWNPVHPDAVEPARFMNELRFIGFELAYGRALPGVVADYLLHHGATKDELRWFEHNGSDAGCIAGNDYYDVSEKEVHADGRHKDAGERLGYYFLAKQYHERLGVPIMHAETNAEVNAVDWLQRQWTATMRLRDEGYPIRGFTWYGFVNHVDWDTALRENNGRENACGLVTLGRVPNATHKAYRAIIAAEAAAVTAPSR